ncbi:hypothetical protein ABIB35_000302 [Arthrobacter sp. UYP6]
MNRLLARECPDGHGAGRAVCGNTAWVRFYGRGTKHWGVLDSFALLQQAGVLRRLRSAGPPG